MAQLKDTTVHGTLNATKIQENGVDLSTKYNPVINVTNNNSTIEDKSVPNSTSTNLGSFTLTTGTWLVIIHVAFASNATGRRSVWLSKSSGGGSASATVRDYRAASSGGATTCCFTAILSLSASTTYYVVAQQTSGTALTVNTRYTTVKLD